MHPFLHGIVPGYFFAKVLLVNFNHNAPIYVKPEGGGGRVSGNPQEFDCDVYPQGEDFDHLIFQLQIAEEK